MPATHRLVGGPPRARVTPARRVFGVLYGVLAPAYDYVSNFFFAGQWTVWQRYALDFARGQALLEIGYGTGDLVLEMCRRGYRPCGVDASWRMRRIAHRKLHHRACHATLLVGDAASLPFIDGSFATVISTFPSEYILDPAVWSEARRVLRPGGRMVVVLSGELTPYDRRSRLLIRFHRFVYRASRHMPPLDHFQFPGFRVAYARRGDERGAAHLVVAERVD